MLYAMSRKHSSTDFLTQFIPNYMILFKQDKTGEKFSGETTRR